MGGVGPLRGGPKEGSPTEEALSEAETLRGDPLREGPLRGRGPLEIVWEEGKTLSHEEALSEEK